MHNEVDKESNDNDSVIYFSDEEDFDTETSADIIGMMKHGVLPPEIQFLLGLCLIGEGGSDFLAGKSIEVLTSFDDDYIEYRSVLEHCTADEVSLELFRRTMVDTLSKTAAYALLTDILIKTKREEEWSSRLLPLYESFIVDFEKSDEVAVMQVNPTALPLSMSIKRNYYVKVLLALQRMRLVQAKSKEKLQEGYSDAVAIVDSIYRYRTALLLEINRDINNETKEVSEFNYCI